MLCRTAVRVPQTELFRLAKCAVPEEPLIPGATAHECQCARERLVCPCQEYLYRQLRPDLVRFLRQRLTHPDEAEDVAHDCFLKCFRAVRCEGGECRFPQLLFHVAGNAAHDNNQLARHRGLPIEAAYDEIPDRCISTDHAVERLIVRQAVFSLRPRDRQAILLHYLCGFSISEVSGRIHESEAAVQSRIHRAKARLLRRLTTEGFFNPNSGGGDMLPTGETNRPDEGSGAEEPVCRRVRRLIDSGQLGEEDLRHVAYCRECERYRRENGRLRDLVKAAFANGRLVHGCAENEGSG